MLKTKNLNLLVLLPINIKNKESTREKLVEINVNEARKLGIASINNIGTQLFSGTNENIYCVLVIFIILDYCN